MSLRTGFLGRGGIGLGPLSVSFGLGPDPTATGFITEPAGGGVVAPEITQAGPTTAAGANQPPAILTARKKPKKG